VLSVGLWRFRESDGKSQFCNSSGRMYGRFSPGGLLGVGAMGGAGVEGVVGVI